jgi:DNA-binding response OmpR family regulator
MLKILIVDDDKVTLGLMRKRLSDAYEIIETEDPQQALALALNHKPDAILLDLMMPGFSGFELCQSFRALSYTSVIPIFVISGEAEPKYKDHCINLGATAYFEKPLNFDELKSRLAVELQNTKVEQRAQARVRMSLDIKLKGVEANGVEFEEKTKTENVSAEGFMCTSMSSLVKDALIEVFLLSGGEHYAGRARVVRKEASGAWRRYGFRFEGKTAAWPLQENRVRPAK